MTHTTLKFYNLNSFKWLVKSIVVDIRVRERVREECDQG